MKTYKDTKKTEIKDLVIEETTVVTNSIIETEEKALDPYTSTILNLNKMVQT